MDRSIFQGEKRGNTFPSYKYAGRYMRGQNTSVMCGRIHARATSMRCKFQIGRHMPRGVHSYPSLRTTCFEHDNDNILFSHRSEVALHCSHVFVQRITFLWRGYQHFQDHHVPPEKFSKSSISFLYRLDIHNQVCVRGLLLLSCLPCVAHFMVRNSQSHATRHTAWQSQHLEPEAPCRP